MCLAICTLCEPTFYEKVKQHCFKKVAAKVPGQGKGGKRHLRKRLPGSVPLLHHASGSVRSSVEVGINMTPGTEEESMPSQSMVFSDEDDDFEGGDNQIAKKDEIDVVNEAKAIDLVESEPLRD